MSVTLRRVLARIALGGAVLAAAFTAFVAVARIR